MTRSALGSVLVLETYTEDQHLSVPLIAVIIVTPAVLDELVQVAHAFEVVRNMEIPVEQVDIQTYGPDLYTEFSLLEEEQQYEFYLDPDAQILNGDDTRTVTIWDAHFDAVHDQQAVLTTGRMPFWDPYVLPDSTERILFNGKTFWWTYQYDGGALRTAPFTLAVLRAASATPPREPEPSLKTGAAT
jgi:hypothetical protein